MNFKPSPFKDIKTYLFSLKTISEHETNFLCQWEAVNSRNVNKDTRIAVPSSKLTH